MLADEGSDVVGTVCIGDPDQMLPAALEMREAVDVPIACQPKGFREGETLQENEERGYIVSRFIDSVTPDAMAEFAVKAKAERISYIGCCCGTGPSHIRAMAEALGLQRESS